MQPGWIVRVRVVHTNRRAAFGTAQARRIERPRLDEGQRVPTLGAEQHG